MVSYNYQSTIFLTTAAYFNALLHIFTVTKNLGMLYFMLYPNTIFYILDLFSNLWRGVRAKQKFTTKVADIAAFSISITKFFCILGQL